MSWLLTRGRPTILPSSGEIMLSWSYARSHEKVLPLAKDAVLVEAIFENGGVAEVRWQEGAQQQKLPLQAEARRTLCELPGGESLILWRQPWWTEVKPEDIEAPGRSRFFLPFQGWYQDTWFDGPLLALHAQTFLGAAASGVPGFLCVETGKEPEPREKHSLFDFLLRSRGQALKLSLAEGFRTRNSVDLQGAFHININEWTARSAALLLLIRLVYPESIFYLAARNPPPSAAWKRLCQNLDIQPNVRSREIDASGSIALDELWPQDEMKAFQSFLYALQKKVPLMPERLLAELSEP